MTTTVSDGNPARGPSRHRRRRAGALTAVGMLVLAACGGEPTAGGDADGGQPDSLTLYTCLSDESIQPIIEAFGEREDGGQVDLFRAPTGELNARVAADARSGGLRADVI